MGAKSFDILNNLDSSNGGGGRVLKLLTPINLHILVLISSIFFLLFSSPSLFKFGQHPNVFINLHLDNIHNSGLSLLKGSSSNFKHLNIMGYVISLQRETI